MSKKIKLKRPSSKGGSRSGLIRPVYLSPSALPEEIRKVYRLNGGTIDIKELKNTKSAIKAFTVKNVSLMTSKVSIKGFNPLEYIKYDKKTGNFTVKTFLKGLNRNYVDLWVEGVKI